MSAIGDIVVNLRANIGQYQQAMKQSQSATAGLQSSIGGLNRVLGAVGAGLSIGGVVAFAKASMDAARESAQAQAKLSAVLKSTGGAAGFTVGELSDYAAELQKVTSFEDDATISAMGMMATFTNIRGDMFKDAIASAQDLSGVMGQDINASVMQIGKALQDPIAGMTALRRVGVMFTDEQAKQIAGFVKAGNLLEAQKVIIGELQREFGGAAKAMADPMVQAKNAFGDIMEDVGRMLLPGMAMVAKEAANFTRELFSAATAGGEATKTLAVGFALIAEAIETVTQNMRLLKVAWGFATNPMGQGIEGVKNFFTPPGANAGGSASQPPNVTLSERIAKNMESLTAMGAGGSGSGSVMRETAAAAKDATAEVEKLSKATEDWANKTAIVGMSDRQKSLFDAAQKYADQKAAIKDNTALSDSQRAGQLADLDAAYRDLTGTIGDYYDKLANTDASKKAEAELKKQQDSAKKYQEQIADLEDKRFGRGEVPGMIRQMMSEGLSREDATRNAERIDKLNKETEVWGSVTGWGKPQTDFRDRRKILENSFGKTVSQEGRNEALEAFRKNSMSSMLDSIKTPMEKMNDQFRDIDKWVEVGGLTGDEAAKLKRKAAAEAVTPVQSPAAAAKGSTAAWSTIIGAMNNEMERKQLDALIGIEENTKPTKQQTRKILMTMGF